MNYANLAFTDAVKSLQENNGSRRKRSISLNWRQKYLN